MPFCTLSFFFFFCSAVSEIGADGDACCRLSLLGLIKTNHPELAPRFFQTDLAPSILGILRSLSHSECGCLANRWKGTDCLL